VAIWHGEADTTVAPANADALAAQWAALHGITGPGERRNLSPRHRLTTWSSSNGTVMVERHGIVGLPHGVPIDTAECGEAAPYILDIGVGSTGMIAAFFGVAPEVALPATMRDFAGDPPIVGAPTGFPGRTLTGVIAVGRDGTARSDTGSAEPAPPEGGDRSPWSAGAKFADETIRRALAAAGLAKS